MTKHLALLASLGKFGLSEHMMLEADLRRHTEAGGRTVQRKVSATLTVGAVVRLVRLVPLSSERGGGGPRRCVR